MTAYTLFLALVFAVGGIALVMARNERVKERRITKALQAAGRPTTIAGYDYAARCVCGWEIGADDPEDAADMLALHEIVTSHAALLDDEWQALATLALTDWPPLPEDAADLPRTW